MNAEELKDLLNSDYGRGCTPLMYACESHKFDLVRRLLLAGSDVNKEDHRKETALIKVITGRCITDYSNPFRDFHFKMGQSYDGIPESQKLKIVNELINAKANVSHRTDMNMTALSYAVGGGYRAIVEELIKNINDPTILDQEEFFSDTPLIIAIRKGDIPIIETLIKAKVNVNYLTTNNMTALTFSFQLFNFYTHQSKEESDALKLEIMDVLIDKGADVNLKDSHGNTPLMTAAKKNQGEIILKKLLDRGADPKIRNGNFDFWDFLKFKKTKDWVFKYVEGFEEHKIAGTFGI